MSSAEIPVSGLQADGMMLKLVVWLVNPVDVTNAGNDDSSQSNARSVAQNIEPKAFQKRK